MTKKKKTRKEKSDSHWHSVRKRMDNTPMKILDTAIALVVVVAVLMYIFWPFDLTITVLNAKGDPTIGHITIVDSDGDLVFEGDRHVYEDDLWKGNYNVTVVSEGYVVHESIVSNKPGFKWNSDVNTTVMLDARMISMTGFSFFDPTTSIELGPSIHMMGKNVLGDYVDELILPNSTVMYGDYIMDLSTNFFDSRVLFAGDLIIQEGKVTRRVVLMPNSGFYYLSDVEVGRMKNFVRDYMDLSVSQDLDSADLGMPKQYYIYGRNLVVPLGDIVFLLCQEETYKSMGREAVYFIPKERSYWSAEGVSNTTTCYARSLIGAVPANVGGVTLGESMYHVLGGQGKFPYEVKHLNSRVYGIPVAFTFDVESGRYVFSESQYAVSPCAGDQWSLGLEDDEIVCDKPEYVAWMSQQSGDVTYDEYDYPHISGIIGLRQIVSYADKYGIPVTNYYVKKDVLAYAKLEPELIEKIKRLTDEGLIEAGSHTRYHTNLGMVKKATARTELKKSREWLSNYFNTTVVGFRAPYHSLIGDEKTHASEVGLAGYSYFSQWGEYSGKVPGSDVEHKQWMSSWRYVTDIPPNEFKEMLYTQPYILTLDHPWNMAYKDADRLVEDPSLLVAHKANVLTAVANGGIPTLVRDLEVENKYTPIEPVK